jgi:two-component system chemotaxis response regulator CheB
VSRTPVRPAAPRRAESADVRLVVVGVSTGGPQALDVFVSGLPADLAVPIVIVQHMPPQFTAALAQRLDSRTPLAVSEVYEGAIAAPGTIWIAKGDYHTEVQRDGRGFVLSIHQGERVNFCRPAVDVLFHSVARCAPGQALGVVLTGMGRDGTDGAAAMHRAGCPILAQDAQTSVVYGMPRAVAEAGIVSEVLPLPSISGRVAELATPAFASA